MKELVCEQIQHGISTELKSILFFNEKGYIVSIPYGNAGRYDLLVDTGKKILKIQCKTASKNANGSYTVCTSNTSMKSQGNIRKYYTKDQIDFIMTFIENEAVFIPVELIEKTASKVFRAELPKNGNTKNCNMIQDYSFDKIFNKVD